MQTVLPPHCLLCGSPESTDALCPACAAALPCLPDEHCPQCAEPTTFGERCGRCLNTPPAFDATVAVFRYEFPVDQLVQSYKYGAQLALGRWLGQQLVTVLAGRAVDLVIPMPLHPDRLRQRGFNQAAEIAKQVGAHDGWPVDLFNCQRLKATAPQAALAHDDRVANVRNAFACRADLSGKRVLLVDDVLTTGATLGECARVLKLHGATHVTAAVIARAVHH